jgi:hypothetical protein
VDQQTVFRSLSLKAAKARTAVLHQLHRAVLASPEQLPDTVLSINVQDESVNDTISFARPAYTSPLPGNPPIGRAFLMPHFSFWAWPLPFIGSLRRASSAVDKLEGEFSFARKIPKVVWRGTKRYNNAHNPHLRTDLLKQTAGNAWADVQELTWGSRVSGGNVATNSLMIEDFCKYKYVIHTEGITYSGRLQFLQMCSSVTITPPIAWLQHTTHLIKPLFSADLDLKQASEWTPSSGAAGAWPRHYGPEEANIIFVAPDWSDLGALISYLENNPAVAEGIATRQRQLFVREGYFSPAAEACYWRELIRGWAKVARTEGEGWEREAGVPWELFAMGYTEHQ